MSSTSGPDPDPAIDYCPFCGMHLPVEGLDPHLDDHQDCAARFAARRESEHRELFADRGDARRAPSLVRTGVMIGIVVVVMAYSLLVAGQLLLGLMASGVVVAAFVLATRL